MVQVGAVGKNADCSESSNNDFQIIPVNSIFDTIFPFPCIEKLQTIDTRYFSKLFPRKNSDDELSVRLTGPLRGFLTVLQL